MALTTIEPFGINSSNSFTFANVTATGNITGNFFIGNGSQLTGLPESYSNANVAAYLPTYTGNISADNITANTFTGNITGGSNTASTVTASAQPNITSVGTLTSVSSTGNITGAYFIGNGSQLTGLPESYANANVAAYLPTYTGNLVSLQGNVTTTANISASHVLGNGSGLSSITGANVTGQVANAQVAGTVYTAAQPNITSVGTLSSVSVSGNLTAGNIASDAHMSAATLQTTGNAIIGGDLVVNGNTIQVNIDQLNVQDPIIGLGRGANNAPLTSNDGKDRGTEMWYYTDAEKSAFVGYQNSTGNIIAASNISMANEIVTVNSYGNFVAGNVIGATVSVTGNITGNYFVGNGSQLTGLPESYANADVAAYLPTYTGNLISLTGDVTTTANVTGNYFLGNGSQLTGLPEGYANANVAAYLPTYTGNLASLTGNVTTTANVSANYFLGNGSQLTGIQAGATTTFSSTAPSSPSQGDIWIDADTGIQYIYFNDGTSSQWAEMEAQTSFSGGAGGNVDFGSVAANILPASDVTYDLGSATYRWRDIYLSGNTINLGGATIKTDAASGAIALIPEPTVANPNPSGMVVSPSGGITVVATVGGEVSGNAIGNAAASPTAAPVPIDITTTAPQNGQALIWDSANSEFVPGNVSAGGAAVAVYGNIANLPLSNVATGSMAFVSGNNRLYLWNGTGWFNIALINTNPTITGGANSSYVFATNGTPIVLTLIASDPEGIPLTWSYQVTSGTLGNTATVSQADNVFTVTPSTDPADGGVFEITFSASDGVNVGTAASSFTLVFGVADPYYKQSVLVSTTATNNGTNNVFVDSSTNNFTVTRNGNATQGTFSPFSPAGWSGYFDGTGDYLSSVVNTSLNVPADTNFTIEGWCYLTARPSTRPAIFSNYNSFTTGGLSFWAGHGSSTVTQFQVGLNGSFPALNAGTIPYNSWFHWAIVRNGTGSNNITVYINGTSIGTISSNVAITTTGNNLWLGASGDAVANAGINGYMSNFRWVTGTALYTTNFTPPTTPLTAVSGTTFLTLQDNRFIDRSTNNFTITSAGTASITPFSPFDPTSPYTTGANGGSAYFDGTGDYLTIPNNTALGMGTGNFTIEFWIYQTARGSIRQILDIVDGNSAGRLILWVDTGGTLINLGASGGSRHSTAAGAIVLNSWIHVALVRSSGTTKFYINGIQSGTDYIDSTNYTCATGLVYLGINSDGSTYPFSGYLSNLRMVKGTAVYTSAFTPPAAPVTAITNTSLLLNSTNANIYDQTGKVDLETVGDAKTSTAVVKYGTTSIALNGTTAYATIPNSDLVNFGSSNFTVEAWIYPTAITGERGIVSLFGYTADRRSWYVALDGSALRIRIGTAGTSSTVSTASASGVVTVNQWQYIAFVRNGNTVTGYVNGVNVVSSAFSGTAFNNTVDPVAIGAVGPNFTGFFAGYISDVRITKGVARYTGNFTPPTAQLGFYNPE